MFETLESQSLWYKYKTQVWPEGTRQSETVHNIMRTIRSIHNILPLAYISVPITSGKIYYELKLQNKFLDESELKKQVIGHNYYLGTNLIDEIIKTRRCAVLYPADLFPAHNKWDQAHFQALWLSIIAEKCTELHMCEGWEFSNGGVEEFTHAMQLKLGIPRHDQLIFWNTKESEEYARERMKSIQVFDHLGNIITLEKGIEMISGALTWLSSNNFSSEKITVCKQLLINTQKMLEHNFYQ